jgi:hypothetical protein
MLIKENGAEIRARGEIAMNVPVSIEQQNGVFRATVPGIAEVHAEAATSEQAVSAVTEQLRNRIANGQLVFINIGLVGISGLAGKYKNDPALREICEEAYRLRDAERDAMFGPVKSSRAKNKKIQKRQNNNKESSRKRKKPSGERRGLPDRTTS